MIVDAHCHVIPSGMMTAAVPEHWRPVLTTSAGRPVVRFRGRELTSAAGEFLDLDEMLAQAGAAGVSHLVISPWVQLLLTDSESTAEAARICRVQNESLAAAADRRDGQVCALGAVPLHDPAAAAAELEYLMSMPGLRGVEVPASFGASYLGEDRFRQFWEAAAGAGAVVFLHPSTTGLGLHALDDHYLWNSVGNPLETAIAAAQLITSGVLERCTGLTVLLAHGGGALLALRGRLRRAFAVRPEARSDCASDPDDLLRLLYFDSLVHDTALLADLVEVAGPEHVLLGSDRPFDMGADKPADDVRALRLSQADEDLILGGNAGRLLRFPNF